MPIDVVSEPGGAYRAPALTAPNPRLMLSPLSTTGHMIGKPDRRPKLELALVLLNVGAYAFAVSAFISSL